MSEIPPPAADAPTVVSTFTGAGGTCLGFRMAGFKTLWASEFIPAARETYRANFPGVHVDERDIREVSGQDILDYIKMEPGELDVLEGSPPCASFSVNGKREQQWGMVRPYSDTKQRTDDLFFEYARLVAAIQPKVFVAENVPGLTQGKAYGYFKMVMAGLESAGYRVAAKIIDAAYLGVPQRRKRLILVGVRVDLDKQPIFPKPEAITYSVGEAFMGLPYDSSADDLIFEKKIGGVGLHVLNNLMAGQNGVAVRGGSNGAEWRGLRRLHPQQVAPTMLANGGGKSAEWTAHPEGKRLITIGELLRLSSFPDDFVVTGIYVKQFERIGRAVPPLVSRAIATKIREAIL